ncbi:Aste57867_1563 [Aphanomyces stellatus]|uniref:Aste57867_1563 protein n=1 Tax=Aphanomyces stellatus TaxID=120398 RepID=A0A485KAY1_9STRA|nr:hypothetical protein As57867_001562 [Aphanomyces stellatus]VFT78776.1 Aste57867_1563 [Aphanomyces stellatus]
MGQIMGRRISHNKCSFFNAVSQATMKTIKNASLREQLLAPEIMVVSDEGNSNSTSSMSDGTAVTVLPDGKHKAMLFDAQGNCNHIELSRAEMLQIVLDAAATSTNDAAAARIPGIRMRDFRQMESAYSASDKPTITIRHEAILVNVDPVAAVILRNCCYVFEGTNNDVTSMLQANFSLHVRENHGAAFEFAAMEAILSCIASVLDEKFKVIKPIADDLLQAIAHIERPRDEFERLRRVQSSLHNVKTHVHGVRELLVEVVDNADNDLHMMHLTKLHTPSPTDLFAFDVDDAVSLFEVYLHKVFGTLSQLTLLLKKAEHTEKSLNLKWTSKRNQLLLVDIPLKVMFLGVWFAAFVTACPAMNLTSYIKDTDGVFWGLFAVLLLFCPTFYYCLCHHLKTQGVTVAYAAPTPIAPIDSAIFASDFLHKESVDVPEDVFGKHKALRFDRAGNATAVEVSRHDVYQMIETAASGVTILEADDEDDNDSSSRFDVHVEVPAVHMRDIRMLDHALAATSEASIAVRQQAILVNCDPIRAVILRDACVVFLPDGSSDALGTSLRASFKEQVGDAAHAIGFELTYVCCHLETTHRDSRQLIVTRRALEAILATVSRALANDAAKISVVGVEQLDMMAKDETNLSVLENLRAVKHAMSDVESKVHNLRDVLMAVLDDEADLHSMYLTKLYKEPKLMRDLMSFDTEGAEACLEAYLQDMYGTSTVVALLINNIQNTESIVMMKLDAKRNYLLSIDLLMTVLVTAVAVPNFLINAFTMNLLSHLEDVDYLYWIYLAAAVAASAATYFGTLWYLRKEGFKISWYY